MDLDLVDLIVLTVTLAFLAAFSYLNAWWGYRLRATRTENELMNLMSTDGLTGESRTAANQVAAQILYPNRFKAVGHVCSTLAAIILIYAFVQWSA